MLCFRCERRAAFLSAKDKKHPPRPRCECGDIESSKIACYMYMPVKPVWTAQFESKDKRPRYAGPMLSAREKFVNVADEADIKLDIVYKKKNTMLYWEAI